jgi:hypothetical protein
LEDNEGLIKRFDAATKGNLPIVIDNYVINDFDDFSKYVEITIEKYVEGEFNKVLSGLCDVKKVNIGEQIYIVKMK